jgi:outer membrane immunogenic protein
MPKAAFASVLATFALISSTAIAADYAPYPARTNASSWQGFYVGANAGYQWGSINNNAAGPAGVAGGVQAG